MTETTKRRLIDWWWVAAGAVAPVVLAVVCLLLVQVLNITWLRYNPAYFTDEYVARYSSPGMVVVDLERALRTRDTALMQELHGLRRNHVFDTRPNMRVTILYEVDETYWNYLFFDTQTYERFPHHIQQVGQRWVAAPEDAVYYYRSGRWWNTAGPVTLLWWLVELLVVLTVMVYRITRGWSKEILGW